MTSAGSGDKFMQPSPALQRLLDALKSFPALSLAALALALAAQSVLEPPHQRALPAVVFYFAAAGFTIWAFLRGEWNLTSLPQESTQRAAIQPPRYLPLFAAIVLLEAAFYFFAGNRFTLLNLPLWIAGISLFVFSLWIRGPRRAGLKLDWEWVALLVAVLALSAFFRFYRLSEVPAEPFSDHAEKILDVHDISQGITSIFFIRNTGREAIQMYWTLLVLNIFGTGFSFMSLKIGTALLGFFILPYVYFLGKELGNPLVGFFALFLFGIAYWPNVISRIGLRFPLYPLFAAPTLYYLIRGLRTRSQNDFILCGIFLGLGLHGYSPFRIMPFVVLAGFAIYILHVRSQELRLSAGWWLLITAVSALIIFLPLLRYALEHPEIFDYRAFSRLGLASDAITGSAWVIFLDNARRALLMFNYDDGNIWVNSIPNRPALDVVSGALFVIGLILLIARYLRGRDWRDLFLLLSIPILLLPSVLSLAFPLENPALNRAGGAAVAASIVGAKALEGFVSGFGSGPKRILFAYAVVGLLFSASAYQNYNLVFREFDVTYRAVVWNSSEMAAVIQKHGVPDSSWIVPYPQWVDTRLPAIELGYVERDLALWPDQFAQTLSTPAPKLFLFKPQDTETENLLKLLYPQGRLSRYTSSFVGKDFMIFFVER